MSHDTLLVAVDVDAHAARVLEEATDLAARLGARLVILHVIPLGEAMDPDVLTHPAAHPGLAADLARQAEATGETLRELAAPAVSRGVSVSLRVAHGDPADAVIRVADEVGARMVIVGTHARKGLVRLILGSVAEAVVRLSPVPVLTVRLGSAADTPTLRDLHIALS